MAFDFNYVNTFKLDPGSDGNPVGFVPDLDTNPAGTKNGILGDMRGSVTQHITPDYAIQRPGADGGFVLAFTNGTGQPASETVYVHNPLKPNAQGEEFNVLNFAPNLLAELEFDAPQSTMEDGTPNVATPWAVGLNFKTGDERDLGDWEYRIGPRLQFINGGNIRFRGAGPDQIHSGTYDGYSGTRFKLVVSIQRTETTFESGSMAFLDDVAFVGKTTVPTLPDGSGIFGMNLVAARFAAASITAVGVSVASTGQDMDGNSQPASRVSVRLIAFRLSWDYQSLVEKLTVRV